MNVQKAKKYFSHYIPLAGIYAASILAVYLFSYERSFVVGVIVGLSAAYTVWGLVHHKIHNDLSVEVMSEYLLMSILGLIVLLSVVFRM